MTASNHEALRARVGAQILTKCEDALANITTTAELDQVAQAYLAACDGLDGPDDAEATSWARAGGYL